MPRKSQDNYATISTFHTEPQVHIQWDLSSMDTLGTEESVLISEADLRGCSVHKPGVWDSQMSPVYRGVLISGVP